MDTRHPLPGSVQLLDDLESIRQLLGDENLQPPLLTETVQTREQIPLLFDQVEDDAPVPTLLPEPEPEPEPEPVPPAPAPEIRVEAEPDPRARRQDALLHMDVELRAAAQLIMQDVIDDFSPHIEAEIKRRLEARVERLLSQIDSNRS